MTTRPATGEDLDTILTIERSAFGRAAYPIAFFRQAATLFGPLFQVAEVDGGVAGYIIASVEVDAPSRGWLLSIGVRPDVQHEGLGARLGHAALDELEARGVVEVRLTVAPSNQVSRRMARRLGFEWERLATDYFGRGGDRVIVRRALGEPEGPVGPEGPDRYGEGSP